MVRRRDVVGLAEQAGFEVEVDGEIFNAYRGRERDTAYIIDPKTGLALQIYNYDYTGELQNEIEMIEKAREKLIKNKEILKKWQEIRNRRRYKLAIQTFNAYKRAEELRKKQKEAELRERLEKGQ